VLVKLDRTRAARLPGLEENVLPIEPALKCFKITYSTIHAVTEKFKQLVERSSANNSQSRQLMLSQITDRKAKRSRQ